MQSVMTDVSQADGGDCSLVVIPGDAYAAPVATDIGATATNTLSSTCDIFRLLPVDAGELQSRWRVYMFKYFDVDAPLRGPGSEKKLRFAWSGLVNLAWHPLRLCQYVYEEAKHRGIFDQMPHLRVQDLRFWDMWSLKHTLEIRTDETFYADDADLEKYQEKLVPSVGLGLTYGDVIGFQMNMPESKDDPATPEEKRKRSLDSYLSWVQDSISMIEIVPKPGTSMSNTAASASSVVPPQLSHAHASGSFVTSTGKRKLGESDAAKPALGPNVNASAQLQTIILEDIGKSTKLDNVRRQLKSRIPGLEDVDTLVLYEERPASAGIDVYNTADGDDLVPAEKPISLPRMVEKPVIHFIKPLPKRKYGNYNNDYGRKKGNEDDGESWKPLRKLYYEILPFKQTLLVYHGGSYVEIVASYRDSTGKALKNSKPFKVLIEQTGRIEDVAVKILEQMRARAATLPSPTVKPGQLNPLAFRFYEVSDAGSRVKRVFHSEEVIQDSLMQEATAYQYDSRYGHSYYAQPPINQPRRDLWRPLGLDEGGKPYLYFEIKDPDEFKDMSANSPVMPVKSFKPADGAAGGWVDGDLLAASRTINSDADATGGGSSQGEMLSPIASRQKAFRKIRTDLISGIEAELTYTVSIVHFSFPSLYGEERVFFDSPILMDISVADTVESVRRRVKRRLGIGDNEFLNWRIAELDRLQAPVRTYYLEIHRGDATVESRLGEQIMNIDEECDCLICYLIRSRANDVVDSSRVSSRNFIPTLGFEHLRRRGNRNYAVKTSWGRNKELKIKR